MDGSPERDLTWMPRRVLLAHSFKLSDTLCLAGIAHFIPSGYNRLFGWWTIMEMGRRWKLWKTILFGVFFSEAVEWGVSFQSIYTVRSCQSRVGPGHNTWPRVGSRVRSRFMQVSAGWTNSTELSWHDRRAQLICCRPKKGRRARLSLLYTNFVNYKLHEHECKWHHFFGCFIIDSMLVKLKNVKLKM